MTRRSLPLFMCVLSAAIGCRSASRSVAPNAYELVEGRSAAGVHADTIDAKASIGLTQARWTLRTRPGAGTDFWSDVALLDMPSADKSASSLEQRTFAAALRSLMDGNPDAAAMAFELLRTKAADSLIRARSRVGLTMALSWRSDWSGMARIGSETDSLVAGNSNAPAAGVERWARALSMMPLPEFTVPEQAVVLRMRRSAVGTPVITVKLNGRPHEFWLDTGASMTLISADVARSSGVKLAATDTLALGVVAGHVEAHAVYVDSMSIGPVMVRGLSAALVNPEVLRIDKRIINGVPRPVKIDGMIGTDVLRHLDVVLDAGAGTITLRRPRPMKVATRNLFWVGYPVVRLVTRDGRPVLFGLDTGAQGSYVTTSLLHKLPETPVAARQMTLTGLGTKALKSAWVARHVSLSDGNVAVELRDVPVMPAQRWTFVNFDGVIGSDVALRTRMHLDFTNGVFDIRASASMSKPMDASGTVTIE